MQVEKQNEGNSKRIKTLGPPALLHGAWWRFSQFENKRKTAPTEHNKKKHQKRFAARDMERRNYVENNQHVFCFS